jgi:hypothetical protein
MKILFLVSRNEVAVKFNLVGWLSHFSWARLVFIGFAQHSVQRTAGSLRDLQAFFWLWVFSTSQAFFYPARVRR